MQLVKNRAADRGKVRFIRVQLDHVRTLILDFTALDLIEEKTGVNILSGSFVPKGVADIRFFLWACLQGPAEGCEYDGVEFPAEGPITEEELGAFLGIEHFQEAVQIMLRLLNTADVAPNSLAPFVPTDHTLIEHALTMAGLKAGELFCDLGCGDGRALAVASKRGARVLGVENDKNRVRVARSLLSHMKVSDGKIIEGLIQDNVAEWQRADVVFVYLLTQSNLKLREALGGLHVGARVVTHDFPMPGWTPVNMHAKDIDGRRHSIYVYEIGKQGQSEEVSALSEEDATEQAIQQWATALSAQILSTPEADEADESLPS